MVPVPRPPVEYFKQRANRRVVNSEKGEVSRVRNWLTAQEGGVSETALAYKETSQPGVVVADHNYDEGSSREHAALQPRYLGGVAVIAKSFTRIHETNLKKQGILGLTFSKEEDHDRISSSDRISIVGLADLAPSKDVTLLFTPTTPGNEAWKAVVTHTMNWEQIEYLKAGSALNLTANSTANAELEILA